MVQANTYTLSYAMLELAVYTDTSGNPAWTTDLSDGAGLEVWPISFAIGCFLPKSYTRTTCKAREEIVSLWSWLLGSPVVSSIAQYLHLSLLPPLLYTTMDMDNFLHNTLVVSTMQH